ncbi:sugar ABC transporter substrate-binding protein [Lichenibacterium minor]|uniref:Sugar ABC transporter substrate-binding protein n=1 Tax=Lichenibacterium minor TaxID=2316528 RepID=A0A4Q2TYN4_9HYPH|nr:sugar ABC transporter substrate-binding protein [Lichenibacterium minor]RYC29229.1 sugar ABC transporter substrate-binding protein [Lichenibacterium minor]
MSTAWTRRAALGGAAALALAAATAAHPAFAAAGDAKGKTVEYVTFGLQFEYQVAMVDGIKKKAAEAGVKLDVIDGKGDPNMQVNEVLDAVTKKPDALLINPVDAKLLVAGVKRANEAKVPVFIMENAPPEGKYLSFVDFDNEAGGAMGADALAKVIGGKGTVLEARGSTGSEAAELRHKGFVDRMKAAYPDITVKSLNTEWVADTAYKMVLDAFTQDPAVRGVFSHNDEMLRGVASALRQIGKLKPAGEEGHVALVGLDGTPLALKRIRDGVQDATVEQSPYAMGGAIFDAIVAHFEGRPVPEKARTEPSLITKANVDALGHWGNAK